MVKSEAIGNILNDDSFIEAMADLKQMHIDMLLNSDVEDSHAREICYMRISCLTEILSHLESIAANAKINAKKWNI
tara:strand:+ start:1916 stop:2143 length:228 start_codon:yes stop_codon:yes gene_type:complete